MTDISAECAITSHKTTNRVTSSTSLFMRFANPECNKPNGSAPAFRAHDTFFHPSLLPRPSAHNYEGLVLKKTALDVKVLYAISNVCALPACTAVWCQGHQNGGLFPLPSSTKGLWQYRLYEGCYHWQFGPKLYP